MANKQAIFECIRKAQDEQIFKFSFSDKPMSLVEATPFVDDELKRDSLWIKNDHIMFQTPAHSERNALISYGVLNDIYHGKFVFVLCCDNEYNKMVRMLKEFWSVLNVHDTIKIYTIEDIEKESFVQDFRFKDPSLICLCFNTKHTSHLKTANFKIPKTSVVWLNESWSRAVVSNKEVVTDLSDMMSEHCGFFRVVSSTPFETVSEGVILHADPTKLASRRFVSVEDHHIRINDINDNSQLAQDKTSWHPGLRSLYDEVFQQKSVSLFFGNFMVESGGINDIKERAAVLKKTYPNAVHILDDGENGASIVHYLPDIDECAFGQNYKDTSLSMVKADYMLRTHNDIRTPFCIYSSRTHHDEEVVVPKMFFDASFVFEAESVQVIITSPRGMISKRIRYDHPIEFWGSIETTKGTKHGAMRFGKKDDQRFITIREYELDNTCTPENHLDKQVILQANAYLVNHSKDKISGRAVILQSPLTHQLAWSTASTNIQGNAYNTCYSSFPKVKFYEYNEANESQEEHIQERKAKPSKMNTYSEFVDVNHEWSDNNDGQPSEFDIDYVLSIQDQIASKYGNDLLRAVFIEATEEEYAEIENATTKETVNTSKTALYKKVREAQRNMFGISTNDFGMLYSTRATLDKAETPRPGTWTLETDHRQRAVRWIKHITSDGRKGVVAILMTRQVTQEKFEGEYIRQFFEETVDGKIGIRVQVYKKTITATKLFRMFCAKPENKGLVGTIHDLDKMMGVQYPEEKNEIMLKRKRGGGNTLHGHWFSALEREGIVEYIAESKPKKYRII
jgi:hypothetical protein